MMKPVAIKGLGIVSACGRGVDALRTALNAGWQPSVSVALLGGKNLHVHPLPPGTLDDKSLGRKVRRADRLAKTAVFAAADALADARLSPDADRSRIGLIVTSALGTHVTTFQFLDEILTYGDGGVSPTVFSHSVQNAPAAYIASTLDLRGPVLTLTQVHFAFHQALLLATGWLANGCCDHVLVGGMDELGTVMRHVCRSLLTSADDGKIRPFMFSTNPGSVPGEGSAFLLLSAADGVGGHAILQNVSIGKWSAPAQSPDLHILEADGMIPDESAYAAAARSGKQLAAYSPLFGSMTGGTALQCVVAALTLKEQTRFASPVTDSALDFPICRETGACPTDTIQLTRLNCAGAAGCIQLSEC
jgi:3-oxoacyl-[acyl-carrier-protein] synthase II